MLKKFFHSTIGEILQIIIISLIIVIPFRIYIAQPFLVSGPSMDDTFHNGQYLIVDELTYHLRNPKRSEVIIFRYPLDTKKFFIKRVIGLPTETIRIDENIVSICKIECDQLANFTILDEPYVKIDKLNRPRANSKITLKENEYLVLGDNRSVSSDSRIWGPVNRELITGRPFLRLFPLSQISLFPGKI